MTTQEMTTSTTNTSSAQAATAASATNNDAAATTTTATIPSTTATTTTTTSGTDSAVSSTLAVPASFLASYEMAKAAWHTQQFPLAIERFSVLAEEMTQALGDSMHPSLSSVWFGYGMALFESAVQEANERIVGGAVAANEGDDEEEDVEDEDDDEEQAEVAAQEDDGDAEWEDAEDGQEEEEEESAAATTTAAAGEPQAEQQGAFAAAEEDVSDFQGAWELLELSRVIYAKYLPESRSLLADVHLSLGDLSLEEEKFEQGVDEYRAALALKQQEGLSREIAEVHYKLAMGLEYERHFAEAMQEMEKAYGLLQSHMNTLAEAITRQDLQNSNSNNNSHNVGKGKGKMAAVSSLDTATLQLTPEQIRKEIDDLAALLPDIAQRMDELKAQMAEQEGVAVQDPLEQFLGGLLKGVAGGLGGASAAASDKPQEQVRDLSGLVKKKKPAVSAAAPATAATTTAEPLKRRAEEEAPVAEEKKMKI